MHRETFLSRVADLRDSWSERRALSRFAGAHDFDSQFRLLLALHGWASQAAADVASVYVDGMPLSVSPWPERADLPPAFSVSVAGQHAATFSLGERPRLGGSRWHISVLLIAGRRDGAVSHAGPERRNGGWTRGRIEDLLLSLLGAYERSLGEDGENGLATRTVEPPGSTPHDAAS